MGLRAKLNDNPRLAIAVCGGCVLLALALYIVPRLAGPTQARDTGDDKAFFSVDDGKTWFADDASKLPPFDHDGKPAYRVRVYHCPHGKDFVGHLERYADADLKRLAELKGQKKTNTMDYIKLEMDVEVKRPGSAGWTKPAALSPPIANLIRSPNCPEGATRGVTRVEPH